MDSLESLIVKAREGDADAYGVIVRRFQDMAVGYSYSILGDFQLAEDAAQEAFFEAHRCLGSIREPAAFPGWFRRIVFKHCDRIMRGKHLAVAALETIEEPRGPTPDQEGTLQQNEMRDRLMEAIEELPEHERETLMLYYISGYSQNEVSQFLSVPVTTVKKRLFSARNRLRGMLVDLVGDSLREKRPSRDELFASRVIDILSAARAGNVELVRTLLQADPRLSMARDPLGNTAMIMAVNFGHLEVAELLTAAGIESDIYEAAAIGNTSRVAHLLSEDTTLLDSYSPEGFTPLALACHFGHLETARFLIDQGANVDAVARHEMQVTPLHAALFGRRTETARLLIERGANVNARRGGGDLPRAGWTPLHYAASFGFELLTKMMLDLGGDASIRDDQGNTPLRVAVESGQAEIERILRERGINQ